ncbi:MAG: ATP-binding protein [Acidobacteriia bacterium]|nr:ATP-binding protein [Terriglobia bacterium]
MNKETAVSIPFSVEVSRMIEVLAEQIYPTAFALLRENVQNSFDAVLLRRHRFGNFAARIDVTIDESRIVVSDNGIGMSRDDLREHFWRAGSSSKNTDEARAAGVVGTFGIGAMANFGIAEELHVETESAVTNERTACSAYRSTLSVTEDCITFEQREPVGSPGTSVTAVMPKGEILDRANAEAYISEFVTFLATDVFVNGRKASGNPVQTAVAELANTTWSSADSELDLGSGVAATVELWGALNGDVRICLEKIEVDGERLEGRMTLRQGTGVLRTFRSGFGLASTGVGSTYSFGGVADFLFLQPTAGREALTTASKQVLQRIVSRVDEFVSMKLAERPECNASGPFATWVRQRGRYDLCSNLRVRIEPGGTVLLREVREGFEGRRPLVYCGTDRATVEHASEDRPIIVPARSSPRRDCEINYLRRYCDIEELSDQPRVLLEKPSVDCTAAEKALAFRVGSILSGDYFLNAQVRFGSISHDLPVLVDQGATPVAVFLNPDGPTAKIILKVYDEQYSAFGDMAKDFVRNMIFPRVSDLVPTATRQGAQAFLKSISRQREVFEYEASDLESLTSLWNDYMSGRLSFQQASERSARVATRSYQVVDGTAAGSMRDVVPDVIENESLTAAEGQEDHGALPPIQRLDIQTGKKLLTIAADEPALKGYRCFLAITNRIQEEHGDFFLQPHRTSVVWGGQRALFIFQHHSGEFGLYYDLQTRNLISDQSGGGAIMPCTIVMKNRVFIPIPTAIQETFLPNADERKRFEVKCDILQIER